MTATATRRAAAHRLALDLAAEAINAAGYAEAKYREIAPARAALSAAERAYSDAKEAAEAAKHGPAQLARALGWLGVNIAAQVDPRPYDGPVTDYRAAFAGGRVTSSPTKYHGTPKGRAYGWILRADLSRGREPGETFEYEPAAGTNDPEKLARQVDDATANLRAWLSGHTAERWLEAHGIDPAAAPPLSALVAFTVDAERVRGDRPWFRPVWTMTLGGATVARIDDRRDLLAPGEHAQEADVLGPFPGNGGRRIGEPTQPETADEEEVRAYALAHVTRARAALLRRFTYQPETDR